MYSANKAINVFVLGSQIVDRSTFSFEAYWMVCMVNAFTFFLYIELQNHSILRVTFNVTTMKLRVIPSFFFSFPMHWCDAVMGSTQCHDYFFRKYHLFFKCLTIVCSQSKLWILIKHTCNAIISKPSVLTILQLCL